MDFEPTYTPEQEAFRREVNAWLKGNVHGGVVCLFLEDGDPEYIGVVPNPRTLLTMEVETASA